MRRVSNLKTIGDMFRQAHCYSAYKGKWHLSRDVVPLEEYGFSDFGDLGDRHGGTLEGFEQDGNIANETIEWIETKGTKCNQKGQSFFLAVNFINPHDIMFFSVHSDKYSVFTKDFKFVRYFSSIAFNWTQTLDELYTQNDVEMYRKAGDEMTNLAFDLTNTKANPWLASLVNNCSKKLNGLITREVGVDQGKETDAYPGGVASYAK